MARANATVAPTAAQVDDYAEQVVLLVRQSAAVQEARVDAFLDGATLAAEQVQDVRLQVLETPAQVRGWELWVEFALLLLETNLVSKAIALASRTIFIPMVRSNRLFLALPKSAAGKELVKLSKNLPGVQFRATTKSVLSSGALGLPGTASPDSLKLYHGSIQAIVRLGSEAGLSGADLIKDAAKLEGERRRRRTAPPSGGSLPLGDSAGVVVLSAAQDYARATRLGIQIRHARIESFVRREATPADLAVVVDALGWDPLGEPGEQLTLSLADLRDNYRLLLEALIWARLYGFSATQPRIDVNASPDEPPFIGIKEQLQDYWQRRFQALADAYQPVRPVLPGRVADAQRLRRYFAAISTELQKVGLQQGELGAAVPRG
jgi:hypothetical protein